MSANDHDEIIGAGIPHSQFGDRECCGCLNGVIRGDHNDIVCNECGKVVRIVQAADLQRTLNEMDLELDFATAKCAYCGAVNVFPGFSKIMAFACKQCGRGNTAGQPAD